MKVCARDVHLVRIRERSFPTVTAEHKVYWILYVEMFLVRCLLLLLVTFFTMQPSLMIFSRKTWIYMLKHKDEVFDKFVEFKASVENLSGRKIKVLRTDNEGEYTSNEFKNFCKGEGIKREFTTTYTPKKNGVVKRKNRSIVEAAKAMIHD